MRYDPWGRGWTLYGTGTVNSDASAIVPDPGSELHVLR
jgi:hypothetical protein